MPEPTPITQLTELIEQNGKAHIPGDLDPDISLSYSSSKKPNSSNDISSIKTRKNKRDKNKKHCKQKKDESSDPSSSDNSVSSYDSDYRQK